ncbi:bifunctional serine/threonine-protein kinase/formylglycine-generating enzyme family protein [Tautonia marina]|uniref:bifunctional serine/threonine-protein kinase/formylglycine-generating enzyme family protein n=1 Tax=Tautonia marina TaxID=2653855 RepID=UPI00126125B2|nr:bifunctional serine/threonine-protein kinase/formylglycine-generating enzyme family protein [Tautonia marina]
MDPKPNPNPNGNPNALPDEDVGKTLNLLSPAGSQVGGTPPTSESSSTPDPQTEKEPTSKLPSTEGGTHPASGSGPETENYSFADLPRQIGLIHPGMVLLDQYEVLEHLGEGGMGAVWLVRNTGLDAKRVLKVINPSLVGSKSLRQRFTREAKLMAKISSHPHATVVHATGVANGVPYIEMEYIRGRSLRRELSERHPIPLDCVARLASQLCDVLGEAHRHGIVHRDLKPENIMLLADREPGKEFLKVLDFGIAKLIEQEDGSESGIATQTLGTEGFIGTAAYASPEQIKDDSPDHRSDLYSLGVILYEMLTGHRPFPQKKPEQLLYAHCFEPPPPFSSHQGVDVPPPVEQVILRCLSKDRNDRPSSAEKLRQEFLEAIFTVLSPAEVFTEFQTPPPTEPRRFVPPVRSELPTEFESETGLRNRRRWIPRWAATGALALVVLGGGTLIGLRYFDGGSGSNSTQTLIHPDEVPSTFPQSLLSYFEARGYSPADDALPDPSGSPSVIIRNSDGLRLFRQSGAYFPAGYTPDTAAGETDLLPNAIVREDGTRFMLVLGTDEYGFEMGAPDEFGGMKTLSEEQPRHRVVLSSFYLQQAEVTVGEMETFLNEVERWDRTSPDLEIYRQAIDDLQRAGVKFLAHPAPGVTRELAEAYAHHVSGQLPSEAQWEYAARSRGQDRPFVWGFEHDKKLANIDSGLVFSLAPTHEATLSPQERLENRIASGDITDQEILDLTGNLREWCRDVWRPYGRHASDTDPIEQPVDREQANYVIRGGSYLTEFPETARTTWRADASTVDYKGPLDHSDHDLGFRVVVEFLPLPSDPSALSRAE